MSEWNSHSFSIDLKRCIREDADFTSSTSDPQQWWTLAWSYRPAFLLSSLCTHSQTFTDAHHGCHSNFGLTGFDLFWIVFCNPHRVTSIHGKLKNEGLAKIYIVLMWWLQYYVFPWLPNLCRTLFKDTWGALPLVHAGYYDCKRSIKLLWTK